MEDKTPEEVLIDRPEESQEGRVISNEQVDMEAPMAQLCSNCEGKNENCSVCKKPMTE